MEDNQISAEYPFQSNFLEVNGSKIHYIDEGEGDPILFLHGNPTSSYLWRNIIPHATKVGRCIAPDLIGMGKSDKPDIEYHFVDHYRYIEAFIAELGLKNITLVIHDWGSAIGFHYAMSHPENIKGIAFMEAILKPAHWHQFSTEYKVMFRLFRTPGIGFLLISVFNLFLNQVLPKTIVRKLTEEEIRHYNEPYQKISDRKPVRQWPCEIPIDGEPADVDAIVAAYHEKLKQSDTPKILFYAHPGGLITKKGVEWCQANLKNLEIVDIGSGIHFIQEDNPHEIGRQLSRWYQQLK